MSRRPEATRVDVTTKLADQILWTAPCPVGQMDSVGFRSWIEHRAHCEQDPRRAERIQRLAVADLQAAEARRGFVLVDEPPIDRALRSPTGQLPEHRLASRLRRGCYAVLSPLLSVRRRRPRPIARGW
jgi:hypothetical protein